MHILLHATKSYTEIPPLERIRRSSLSALIQCSMQEYIAVSELKSQKNYDELQNKLELQNRLDLKYRQISTQKNSDQSDSLLSIRSVGSSHCYRKHKSSDFQQYLLKFQQKTLHMYDACSIKIFMELVQYFYQYYHWN